MRPLRYEKEKSTIQLTFSEHTQPLKHSFVSCVSSRIVGIKKITSVCCWEWFPEKAAPLQSSLHVRSLGINGAVSTAQPTDNCFLSRELLVAQLSTRSTALRKRQTPEGWKASMADQAWYPKCRHPIGSCSCFGLHFGLFLSLGVPFHARFHEMERMKRSGKGP